MDFTTKIIAGTTYISHREIAKTSFLAVAESEGIAVHQMDEDEYALIFGNHVADIKRDLIEIAGHDDYEGEAVREGFGVYADKALFFELAQKRNWPETYMETVRLALGEYDEFGATELLEGAA